MRDEDPIDRHERLPLFAEDSNRSPNFVPTFPDLRLPCVAASSVASPPPVGIRRSAPASYLGKADRAWAQLEALPAALRTIEARLDGVGVRSPDFCLCESEGRVADQASRAQYCAAV